MPSLDLLLPWFWYLLFLLWFCSDSAPHPPRGPFIRLKSA